MRKLLGIEKGRGRKSNQEGSPRSKKGKGPEGVEHVGGDSEADNAASKSDETQCSDSEAF